MAGNSEDTKKKAELLNDSDSDSENEKQKEVVEDDTGLLSLINLNLGPKKKLLVISLGGLLCHRVFHKERTTVPIRRKPGALIGNYKIYKGSHCTEFMKFCLERFEVEIWSSARDNELMIAFTELHQWVPVSSRSGRMVENQIASQSKVYGPLTRPTIRHGVDRSRPTADAGHSSQTHVLVGVPSSSEP
ncbi:hypothetical protein LWI28_026461 [Acer negundo]|uniref:FCP1 homology domain-containing protein n=1 Tax=Acer negundo TaxID=4023 RepID=A0AAD5I8A7_ACENE|nr:hypothetical protein LWI28_026461 [Acer negundo]